MNSRGQPPCRASGTNDSEPTPKEREPLTFQVFSISFPDGTRKTFTATARFSYLPDLTSAKLPDTRTSSETSTSDAITSELGSRPCLPANVVNVRRNAFFKLPSRGRTAKPYNVFQ